MSMTTDQFEKVMKDWLAELREVLVRTQPGVIGIDPAGVPIREESRDDETPRKVEELTRAVDAINVRIGNIDDTLQEMLDVLRAIALARVG